MGAALGQPRYVPRAPGNTLKSIIEDSLEELQRVYGDRFKSLYGPLTPRVIDLFERYLRCGDPHFGFLRIHCASCGHEHLLPFSCKARGLCPSCHKRRAIELAERIAEDVLPRVSYAPLVFTIPKIVRRAFLFDRKLYGEFCKVAYRVVRELFEHRFPDVDKPVPAFVASAQSFGDLLNFHPHVHGLVSMGVFDSLGEFHEDLDLDVSELEPMFRERFLEMLKRRDLIDEDRIELINSWPHSGFRVHAERVIAAGSTGELESLLKYMERPPVSLKRLTYMDTGMVHYQGRYHPGLGRDHQLLTGVEFLALLVPHIQHRHEIRCRLYGAVSTTLRRRFGWIRKPEEKREDGSCQLPAGSTRDDDTEEVDSEFHKARRRGWARLIQKVWLDDPLVCPKCGDTMKIISALSHPHQERVIEAILRARKEWNPPWARAGPQASNASGQDGADGGSGERTVEYDVDPCEYDCWPDD